MDRADHFEPLTDRERTAAAREHEAEADEFTILPVPDDALAPPARHATLGKPARRFPYHDANGRLIGQVCRFESEAGKELRPLFYGTVNGGTPGWRWRYPDRPRPLFGLELLAARSGDRILLCEGEKAATAARELLGREFVCIASPCGASAAATADWTPLAGRDAVIWPDRDEAGERYAASAASLLRKAGAARVRIVAVPDEWFEGWDLSDPLPAGVAPDAIRRLLDDAPEWRPDFDEQAPFRVVYRLHRDRGALLVPGLYRLAVRETKEGDIEEWRRIGSLLEVVADTRNGDGVEWGRLLRIHDRDGAVRDWAMPMELLAGSGEDCRRELLRRGFELAAGAAARAGLHDFLISWRPSAKARCVDRCGWHGAAFVLPARIIGPPQRERVVLQTSRPPKVEVAGTLEDWRQGVAAKAVGNSRLAFAVSLGFAGPLLQLAGETSGGFTEVGASSIGKSTLLRAASSVGGVEVMTWRATSNGLEAIAAAHNDQTLVLDELGQAVPADLEAAAYMLANERGKARMHRSLAARDGLRWRLLLYASGEVGLAAKLGEAGKRPRAGQEVRLVDLPADAGTGLGVFEDLHGFADGDALARHLAVATEQHRGVALVAFIERLAADLDGARALILEGRQRFVERVRPAGADGQVLRVAGRMGLIAAAGELATAWGITGWPQGIALQAVERRFKEWLVDRGGPGAAEDRDALAQARQFIERHGMARFEPAWANEQEAAEAEKADREPREIRIVDRAGFRRLDESGAWTFYVLPEVWRSDVCRGLNPARVAGVLRDAGHLRPGEGKNLARNERIPGIGITRVYALLPSIIASGGAP